MREREKSIEVKPLFQRTAIGIICLLPVQSNIMINKYSNSYPLLLKLDRIYTFGVSPNSLDSLEMEMDIILCPTAHQYISNYYTLTLPCESMKPTHQAKKHSLEAQTIALRIFCVNNSLPLSIYLYSLVRNFVSICLDCSSANGTEMEVVLTTRSNYLVSLTIFHYISKMN